MIPPGVLDVRYSTSAPQEVSAWLRVLPPLTELETLLFRTIAVGFALLTATLLTGMMFVENLFAQHLVHKTVLSVLSWIVFGVLLIPLGFTLAWLSIFGNSASRLVARRGRPPGTCPASRSAASAGVSPASTPCSC